MGIKMKEIGYIVLAGFIVIMSVIGFVSMGIDKYKAIKNRWRISERTLLLIAFMGGGIGSFFGMKIFHHKTKNKKFFLLLPILAVFLSIFLIIIFCFLLNV